MNESETAMQDGRMRSAGWIFAVFAYKICGREAQNQSKLRSIPYDAVQDGKQDGGTSKIACEFSKNSTDYDNNNNNGRLGSSNDELKKSGNAAWKIRFLNKMHK